MGTLALSRIVPGGRRTLGPSAVGTDSSAPSLATARGWLKSLGFARIAERVLAQETLDSSEIAALIADAPLAVLSYLVNELGRDGGTGTVRPVVVLPEEILHQANAGVSDPTALVNSMLGRLPPPNGEELQVVVPGLSLSAVTGSFGQALAVLCRMRPEIAVVGPAPEEIISWYGRPDDAFLGGTSWNRWFSETLSTLQGIGVKRLRATRDLGLLQSFEWGSLATTVCTAVDTMHSARGIAAELQRLEILGQERNGIIVWLPGLSRSAPISRYAGAALDLMLLRVLAVGTICCPSIRSRRATSRYLSLSALQLAPRCGANEFGFGARDEHAAAVLSISRLDDITEALRTPRRQK